MNTYELAELRLMLNRYGHHDWSLEPDAIGNPDLLRINDYQGRLALMLIQRGVPTQPRWRADIPVSPRIAGDGLNYHWQIVPTDPYEPYPTQLATALSNALSWLDGHPGEHRPQAYRPPTSN